MAKAMEKQAIKKEKQIEPNIGKDFQLYLQIREMQSKVTQKYYIFLSFKLEKDPNL